MNKFTGKETNEDKAALEERIQRLDRLFEKEITISQNLFLISMISLEKKDIKSFFEMQGIRHLAVYGLGKVGRAFLKLLETNHIFADCIIDSNPNTQADNKTVIHDVDVLADDIDAIIVTTDFYFEEIKKRIEDTNKSVRIILLHDLLDCLAMIPRQVGFVENKPCNDVKLYAFYLPQFHRIPENDQWWGDGYTEWTAVKDAKPLWNGHKQPVEPMDGNFYDLMDKSTMEWQAGLMKEYGIDGLCIYHYWFKDGKKILEKPAENLIGWTDIDIPFCFCWANESWIRTWSNIKKGNTWNDKYEQKTNEDRKGVLLQQSYGMEEEWRIHFEYLLPFFYDNRYLKMDNKPVVVIYKPSEIPCLCVMKDYWNDLAKDCGFDGLQFIYLTEKNTDYRKNDLYAQRSPVALECYEGKNEHGVREYSYDKTWQKILDNNRDDCLYTGFVSYDDTPRRGTKGCVFRETSAEKFQDYLTVMLAQSAAEGKDIAFLNAWNEWGEGMYLEPDVFSGYKMLEAVKYAKKNYTETCVERKKKNGTVGIDSDNMLRRTQHNLDIFDRWLYLKEEGADIYTFLRKNNIKKVAVYGYNIIGRHLINEFEKSGIEVCSVVDKRTDLSESDCTVVAPDMNLDDADAIVVAAVNYFDEIYKELRELGIKKRIINFEQILTEIDE